MREFLLYICALAIVQVLITSCNDAMNSDSNIVKKVSDDGNVPLGDILPLSIGNYWNYHRVYRFINGENADDTIRLEIKRDTIIGENTWYFIENFLNIQYARILYDYGYVMYRNKDYDFFIYSAMKNQEFILWKYPVSINENLGDFTVKNNDTIITVPTGSYHTCFFQYVMKRDNIYSIEDFFLCPFIGIIKYEYYSGPNSETIRNWEVLELISYKVNK